MSSWTTTPVKPLSFFLTLPVPCSDRKSPFLVPSLQGRIIGAPAACQNAPLGAGPEDFLPFLAKNTGPAFDRRGRGDSIHTDGAKPSSIKNSSPLGLSDSPSCPQGFGGYRNRGWCFPQPGRNNYRKESTGRVYRFMGGPIARIDSGLGGSDCTK